MNGEIATANHWRSVETANGLCGVDVVASALMHAPAALVIVQTVNLHCGYFNWLDHLSVHPSTRVSDTLCCVRRRLPVGSIVRSVPSSL